MHLERQAKLPCGQIRWPALVLLRIVGICPKDIEDPQHLQCLLLLRPAVFAQKNGGTMIQRLGYFGRPSLPLKICSKVNCPGYFTSCTDESHDDAKEAMMLGVLPACLQHVHDSNTRAWPIQKLPLASHCHGMVAHTMSRTIMAHCPTSDPCIPCVGGHALPVPRWPSALPLP